MASTLSLRLSRPNNFSKTVIVDKSGGGHFKTIQDAIDSVPKDNNKWFHIVLKPGIYVEKVSIPADREYIFLEGSGYSVTKINWDDCYLLYNYYRGPPTFSLHANNFVAKNIAFMNSYNASESETYEYIHTTIAAKIFGDRVAFYNCAFYGFKWTLFDSWGRHYYNSCYIEGAIHFIRGEGTSVFENCTINVTAKGLKGTGCITAQERSGFEQKNGFVFTKGSVVGAGKAFLGKPDGKFSRVIFSEMMFSSVVHSKGWSAEDFIGYESYFTNVEAGCKGPGAETSGRAKWTKIKKADSPDLEEFTIKNFIDEDGWIANTRF